MMRLISFALGFGLAVVMSGEHLGAQPAGEAAIIKLLQSRRFTDHRNGVAAAIQIPTAQRTPALWKALIREVNQATKFLTDREAQGKTNDLGEEWGNFLHDSLQALVGCPDPAAIDAVLPYLDTGAMATSMIAAYGELAVRKVIAVGRSRDTTKISSAMVTLQKMLAVPAGTYPLSKESRAEIAALARERLEKPEGNAVILGRAAELGALTGEPDLRDVVERLAREPGEVASRGIKTPGEIALVQKLAADALRRSR